METKTKQPKTKYRYYWAYHGCMIRFNVKTGEGQWYSTTLGRFSEHLSELKENGFNKDSEITLSQGLHYMKGNYVE